MNKYFKFLTWLTIFSAMGLLLLVGYWLYFPYKTVVFSEPKFPVINKTIKQGKILTYTSNYCKYTSLPAKTNRTFVNGLIYSTPEMFTNRERGCHSVNIGIIIPAELPPGVYHIENTYSYRVNPIRIITVSQKSENFTVVE